MACVSTLLAETVSQVFLNCNTQFRKSAKLVAKILKLPVTFRRYRRSNAKSDVHFLPKLDRKGTEIGRRRADLRLCDRRCVGQTPTTNVWENTRKSQKDAENAITKLSDPVMLPLSAMTLSSVLRKAIPASSTTIARAVLEGRGSANQGKSARTTREDFAYSSADVYPSARFSLSQALMKRSISPSNTAWVLPVSASVRRSLTSW